MKKACHLPLGQQAEKLVLSPDCQDLLFNALYCYNFKIAVATTVNNPTLGSQNFIAVHVM